MLPEEVLNDHRMTRRALFIVGAKTGPELRAGADDCQKLYDTMIQEKFGGVDARLSSLPLTSCATRVEYLTAFSGFLTKSEQADQRIIYFTGHGKVMLGSYGLMLGSEFLAFAAVTGMLNGGRARTLFILDTCHSGAADLGGVKTDGLPLDTAGSAIFASSRDIQLSHEDGELGSLFTHYLCECITSGNGGAPTTAGLITVPDAIDFIRKKMKDSGRSAQNPIYTVRNSEGPLWIALNVSGSTNHALANAMVENAGDMLGERCSAARLDALDADLLAQYAVDHLGGELKTIEAIADALDLCPPGTRDVPSKAAVLCFGRRPSVFFPNAISMFSAGERSSDSFERSPIDGPLLRQLQNLVQLTTQQLRTEVRFDDGGVRTDVLEIPVLVLREAIANALAHRDFKGNGRVHVHVDADYVTISNPGTEPDGRTWPDMLEHPGFSLTTNRRLANLLQAVRGYEGVGRGFDVLHRYRLERGDDAVMFEQLGSTVVCKLRRLPAGTNLIESRRSEARLGQFILERAHALSHHREPIGTDRPSVIIGQPAFEGRAQLLGELEESLRKSGSLITLSGSAGSGKSYVLRQLFLRLALKDRDRLAHGIGKPEGRAIPIFVSLRDLNADLPFLAAVSTSAAIEYALLEYIFKRHDPVLILDGLDECAPSDRPQLVQAIQDARASNPRLSILISSRQVEKVLIDRSEVSQEIGNLSRDDARRIINAEMPPEAAESFWRMISARDEQLLLNPLMLRLAIEMYGQYADLPGSIDELVAGAFEVLWHRHDAAKGRFIRQRRTTVELDFARRILGRLALFLSARRLVAAPQSDVVDFLSRSLRADAHQFRAELSIRPKELLLDFMEAGLLVDDGADVTFTHRAFFEYFALDGASDLNLSVEEFGRLILGLVGAGIGAERVVSAIGRWPALATEHEALKQVLSDETLIHPMWRDALERVRDGVSREAEKSSRRVRNLSDLLGD